MEAGGVQVQHQPSNQGDPTRQNWRNANPEAAIDQNGRGGAKMKTQSKATNGVNGHSPRSTASTLQSTKETYTPLALRPQSNKNGVAQYPSSSRPQQQQTTYAVQQKAPGFAKSTTQQQQQSQQANYTRTSPQMMASMSPSQPPQYYIPGAQAFNFSKSPPKTTATLKMTTNGVSSNGLGSKPGLKPLNTQMANQNGVPKAPNTATFAPKVSRALNIPQPPKSATFAKSTGFPKITHAPMQQYAFVSYGDQTFIQAIEAPQLSPQLGRRFSNTPAPLRYIQQPAYRQMELAPGTPMVVLSHPEENEEAMDNGPPTPGFGPPEGYGAEVYDMYGTPYENAEEGDDGQLYYYYYDYPTIDYYPATPATATYPRTSMPASAGKEQRRRSVFGGPMKVHPDAVLPIRQPKGPDMAKNFAARIRRKAVNKLFAAAAERRSKSAADRRSPDKFL